MHLLLTLTKFYLIKNLDKIKILIKINKIQKNNNFKTKFIKFKVDNNNTT